MIKDILQRLSGLIQSSTGSYRRHNSEYTEAGKFEKEKAAGLENIKSNLINGSEMRVFDLLEKHPSISIAVDVGSGTGWSAAALSSKVKQVFAIEPSEAAIDISKRIFPETEYANISWINGFAEQELQKLQLEGPALFLTGCVLSHIRDKEVIKICHALNACTPVGSILSFAECWGDKEWHQLMWHVRTKDWWQAQLPGWELDFYGPVVPEKDEYKGRYHKGIHGVKVS